MIIGTIRKKGRQERALCLILASIFSASFQGPDDKVTFNSLLKKVFDFEVTNFIEEILANLLKEQLSEDGLRYNSKQVQKVLLENKT